MAIQIIDSYPESNYDADYDVYAGNIISFGQSFSNLLDSVLENAKFYLKKYGTPTGNIYAKIYEMTGTYGSTGVPTGAALAVSDAVDIASLTTSSQLITFTFSGAEKISLAAETYYVIQVESANGDADNFLKVGYDSSNSTHDGNISRYNGTNWFYSITGDCIFYVNGEDAEPELGPSTAGNFFMVFYP